MLKPQDILVLLKLVAIDNGEWSFGGLAVELGMSSSEVHAACNRALEAKLAIKQSGKVIPLRQNLKSFIVNGLPFVFYPVRGELVRGMPTGHGAEPLAKLMGEDGEPVPVWPDPEGSVRGISFKPLFKAVPKAAKKDQKLYKLLVLVDAIRAGNTRERKIAIDLLEKELG